MAGGLLHVARRGGRIVSLMLDTMVYVDSMHDCENYQPSHDSVHIVELLRQSVKKWCCIQTTLNKERILIKVYF
jgi:hypothetical protein